MCVPLIVYYTTNEGFKKNKGSIQTIDPACAHVKLNQITAYWFVA